MRWPRSRPGCPASAPVALDTRRPFSPSREISACPLCGPVRRDLRSEPETVQQVRHSPQRVRHAEQPGDQRRDPGQRPPLILVPAAGGRVGIQCCAQPGQLVPVQLADAPRQALWKPAPPRRRPARRAATGTPTWRSPATTGRSASCPRPARTSPRPRAAPALGGTVPARYPATIRISHGLNPASATRHPDTPGRNQSDRDLSLSTSVMSGGRLSAHGRRAGRSRDDPGREVR